MNVTLTQKEITQAIKDYISNQGINIVGKQVTMTLTAGRKENGLTASVIISDTADVPNVPIARACPAVASAAVIDSFDEPKEEKVEAQYIPEETEESVSQKSLFGA